MDPITGAIAIAGLGMQLFGAGGAFGATSKAATIASQEAGISMQNADLQMHENQQRQLAMQISARRQMTQNTRQAQMQASQSLVTGVGQTGGTQGSAVQAGQQAATSGGAYNNQGVQQQLGIGNNLFGIQNQISRNQITMAGLGGDMATQQGQASMFQGIGAIGGSLTKSAGPLGNILGNFFGNSNDPTASQFGYDSQNNFMNPQGRAIGGV